MNNILNTNISIEDILSLAVNKQEIKSMELEEAYKVYLKLREPIVRPDTIRAYHDHILHTIRFLKLEKVYETKHILQKNIDNYVKFCKSISLNNITINKRVKMFFAMLNKLHDVNLIDLPNLKYEKLKETPKKIDIIKQEDIIKIINQIDTMKLSHQVMIYLLIGTGIRRNELVNIKTNNINFDNHSIYLDFTKSGKPRYCYFNDHIAELIKKLINQNKCINNPYLFALGEGHIDKISVSSMLFKLKHDLKIDVLSSHKFRHYYATQLLKNGADIFIVKELLGHSDLRMTQRYIDYTNDEIKNSNFKFNPLNKL